MKLSFCFILKVFIIQKILGYAINVKYVENIPTISIKISMPATLHQQCELEIDCEVDDSIVDNCDNFEVNYEGYEDMGSPIIVTKKYSDTPLNRLIKNMDDSDYSCTSSYVEPDDLKNNGVCKLGYWIIPIFYKDDCNEYGYISAADLTPRSSDDEYLQVMKYKDWIWNSLNKNCNYDETTHNTAPQIFNPENLYFTGTVPACGNLRILGSPFLYNNRIYPYSTPKFYKNNDATSKDLANEENHTEKEIIGSDVTNLEKISASNFDFEHFYNSEDASMPFFNPLSEENPIIGYVPASGTLKILGSPLDLRNCEDFSTPSCNKNYLNLNELSSLEDSNDYVPGGTIFSDYVDLSNIVPTSGILRNSRLMPISLNLLSEYDNYDSFESIDFKDEIDNELLNKISVNKNTLYEVAPVGGSARNLGSTRDPTFREYFMGTDNNANSLDDVTSTDDGNNVALVDNFLINGDLQVLGTVPAKGVVKIVGTSPNACLLGNCVSLVEDNINEDIKYDQTIADKDPLGENGNEEILENMLCFECTNK